MQRPAEDTHLLLSRSPAGPAEHRVALAVLLVSIATFAACAPFATLALPQVSAFMPMYEAAVFINELMTAVLLYGQFRSSRSPGLLVLAAGYLFTALMVAVHAMSFPQLFSPTGLLGAGPQTTAWLYMFWHGGFPLFVVAYALLDRRDGAAPAGRLGDTPAALAAAGAVLLLVLGLALLATAGHALLPAVMAGNHYTPAMLGTVTTVWLLGPLAMVLLWRRRPYSVLDLALMTVAFTGTLDVVLSAGLNGGRYDLGFYTGRVFGLLASLFVLTLLLLENGVLYSRLLKAHDAERRKAADAERLSLQLERANAELGDRNVQLVESSRLKSEFLSNMSHELRTPLNAIIGFSELMKDGMCGEFNPRQKDFLGHIHNSGKHLLALINDILDLSKIEAGKVEIELEPVDLTALLDDTLAVVTARAAARKIRVRSELRNPLGALQVDRRRLKQILDNLLTNATKFTPPGGQVVLRAALVERAQAEHGLPGFAHGLRLPLPPSSHQRFVELSVSDSGIGLRPEDAARLFTPFTQIPHPLTRQVEGTGLGLAMVRRLAELHEGTVAVSSQFGQGSCFTVWLPWRQQPMPPDVPAAGGAAAPRRDGGRLALVVEDDAKAAVLMRAQLESAGLRVHHVGSAEEALALTEAFIPDVITLDVRLPGMDGWEFLARLREVPRWDGVPVVVVSVEANEGRGFSLGASVMLQKPVGREALAKGLSRLGLAPSPERDVTVLVVDDDAHAVEILASHLHQAGCIVLRALGGKEGIALAQRFHPDLIALDLDMPQVNGFDVVEALKGDQATARIPVVVVTAKDLSAADRAQLNGHINDIVDKASFNPDSFMGEVQRAMARTA